MLPEFIDSVFLDPAWLMDFFLTSVWAAEAVGIASSLSPLGSAPEVLQTAESLLLRPLHQTALW